MINDRRSRKINCSILKKLDKSPLTFQESLCRYLRYSQAGDLNAVSNRELFSAVSLVVRDYLIEKMLETRKRFQQADAKQLYYLSMEFLMGRSLGNNLYNLGIFDTFKTALSEMGIDLEEIREKEKDAALGNGGLGRLAACFLDSLATLDLPGYGYGINYEFGLFKQEIENGYQKERADNWLSRGNPWQIERAEDTCIVPVYGRIEHARDKDGNYNPMWLDWKILIGVPYDMPIAGYGGKTVNFLRLYSARSSDEFDIEIFNQGDYQKAVAQKVSSEIISKVLYPSESVEAGKELRLIQEYFFAACSLRDIIRQYQSNDKSLFDFPSKVAIHLNDTHPAIAIAELMRILVDENHISWETAWNITRQTFAYTNHTLLQEALEKWSVPLIEYLLPRHLQIIYEINRRFLEYAVSVGADDPERLNRISIIEEGDIKHVRMANLAICGSHSVNGVAKLHTELLKRTLVPDFYQLFPEKFNNKTNGITQRRWLLKANPSLANLISECIGDGWITDIEQIRELEPFAKDKGFQQEFLKIKERNKKRLAKVIQQTVYINVNPDTLFDIHVKRIHEYKRQLLNVLNIIHQYLSIVEDGKIPSVPRTYIFAGKAAPGYWAAKQIIKLINNVSRVINRDARVKEMIQCVFIPDYRVSLAEKIIPAADLSEQISTAGKEASGTGNMKFALNGALIIGTLDGANIEIMEEVGKENIFIFGLNAEEIQKMRDNNSYHPFEYYHGNPYIRRVMDALNSDMFCRGEPGLFKWIYDKLLNHGDEYFHLADLESYIEAHKSADACFNTPELWTEKAVSNISHMGRFSSDRTVSEYAGEIWNIKPVKL